MNLMEKLRHALDLIDNDKPVPRGKFLLQPMGILTEIQINGRVEQIVTPNVCQR